MKASGTYNTLIMTKKNEVVRIGGYSVAPVQYPWLADHIFRNVPVLPGSFIIDLTCGISRELYLRFPRYLRNLKFLNPIILTSDISSLVAHTSRISTFRRKMFFSETDTTVPVNELNNISAELELDLEADTDNAEGSMNFNLFDFIKSADETEPAAFYSNLYNNGNQYGNGFRNIEKIWSKDNRAAAKLKNINSNSPGKVNLIHPALLDSAFQLISLLSKNNDTAFVLDSIKEVKILNTGFQNDLWCCAELTPNQNIQTGFEGEAGIFNSSGDLCIRLSGVNFKYPDQLQRKVKIKKKVIIAANFTADPLEDSLKFWNEYFSSPFSFEFAPYNQIYQQLLDPSGTFYNNQNGINVILLNPEEWMANDEGRLLPVVTGEGYKSLLKNKKVYLLPNKMEIVHVNRYETDYLYKEIFRNRCYQKHEITLNDNDTVIDVGANIGLFTLYVNAQIHNARVFSYEPSPFVFELLRINAGLYCSNTKVFNQGISGKRRKALFTFYPNSSVFSGFAADQTEDSEIIRHIIGNILRDESDADDQVINNYINEITGDRLH
ncbi:MAG TPA: FkbM family methyltransferase, partial [Ignavibacteriaceae bacterium]|nr:FkbM family methyltransferase [Ignavibacteriaceae bacterium]